MARTIEQIHHLDSRMLIAFQNSQKDVKFYSNSYMSLFNFLAARYHKIDTDLADYFIENGYYHSLCVNPHWKLHEHQRMERYIRVIYYPHIDQNNHWINHDAARKITDDATSKFELLTKGGQEYIAKRTPEFIIACSNWEASLYENISLFTEIIGSEYQTVFSSNNTKWIFDKEIQQLARDSLCRQN